MAKVENDLDIYYGVGNTNTQRQENEITAIIIIGLVLLSFPKYCFILFIKN